LNPGGEKQLLARIAAAIWASIGAFGLLVTFEPVRTSGAHVTELRGIAAAAAVIAAVLLVLPSRLVTKRFCALLVVLMVAAVSGLAFAGGTVRGDLTILYTFVVVFSAYFLSWRMSAVHLGLIAILLVSRLFVVEEPDSSQIETIRFAILLPALVTVWALVSLLRKGLIERESRLRERDIHDPETGLLSRAGLDQTLDAELGRATRHARPLSLVYLDLTGAAFDRMDEETSARVATTVARSLVGRIRVEDHAARVGPLKFAVLAVETAEGETVARALKEQVRKRLLGIGYENNSFLVAIGWATYQYEDVSKQALLSQAEHSLSGRAMAPAAAPVEPAPATPPLTGEPATPVLARVNGESIPPPSSPS
jgi:diguanylate cyclase (GGDEF)-like protein